jgi:hypothetical protein
MTYTSEDSLKVSENDDGSFAIEWDPNDPRYAIFNTMTEDELRSYILKSFEEYIKQYESAGS